MRVIALFLPAVISLAIRYSRCGGTDWKVFVYIKEYVYALLFNVFAAQSLITYILGAEGVSIEAFDSFPFFTKYIFIACVLAFLFPYAQEFIGKYAGVSFGIKNREENEK